VREAIVRPAATRRVEFVPSASVAHHGRFRGTGTVGEPLGGPVPSAAFAGEAIERLARIFVGAHGVAKIRLTGGEPLVRREVERLVEMLARSPGSGTWR
jgi:hypothetical protein